MLAWRHIGRWVGQRGLTPVLTLALVLSSACQEDEAGVLVNVQLETTDLQVSELRLRGFATGREDRVLEVTSFLPGNVLFGQTENLYVEVLQSWIGEVVWLQAEGSHNGVVTAHGSVSVLPRRNTLVEATLVLVAGDSLCGNGAVDPGEPCDATELDGHTCASVAGLPHGLLTCVDCEVDAGACHHCGNGEIEAGPEFCDGESLGGETCGSQGFVTGELRCSADCRLDRSACKQGCGNGVVEPGEECDGADLGRSGCADHGFLWGHLSCTTDCNLDTGGCVGECGDDVLDPLEDCDGSDFGDQTCLTAAGADSGSLRCTQGCYLDVGDCHTCGDGVIEAAELCDGSSLAGKTCQDFGFAAGTLACAGDCTFDDSGCGAVNPCGNGTLDAGEQCDSTALNGQDCVLQGFGSGSLACDASCMFDTSGCVPVPSGCGNGYVSVTEECDDGNLVTGDGCDASCLMEPGYRCYDDPSICLPDVAVLFVDCGVACGGAGTLADPLCSIQDAVSAAFFGDLIWLLPSTCIENVSVGSSDADVIIAGDASALWSGASCPALAVDARVVLVYGLHLTEGGEVSGVGGSLTVRHSEIGPSFDSCEAVFCHDSGHVELDRNRIHDNITGGIYVIGGSFRIINNFIVDNGTLGTSFRGGLSLEAAGFSPTELVNNTIAFNKGRNSPFISGVRCVSSIDVRNNIIWTNSVPEVSPTCDPWYNIVSQPPLHLFQGNLDLMPLFVDPAQGDYHILPNSPAVDAGDPSGIPPATVVDFDGVLRFTGLGVDCGADEAL